MNGNETFFFPAALINGTWCDRVSMRVHDGVIKHIEVDTQVPDNAAVIDGIAIPGMLNVHSHAFQRAFAGLSEYRTADRDSFWTWRKLMYECATRWTPDDIYGIALGLYRELLENGYTWVGEFHYLHNDIGGSKYDDLTTMSDAVIRAAQDAGIGICILPVLYQRAGFSGGDLDPAQLRFVLDEDTFLGLVDQLRTRWGRLPDVRVGIAFHSLRAVGMDVINRVTAAVRAEEPATPIHIHVAEQTREVAECEAAVGRRPVEYLLSEAEVDAAWCLIHATHLSQQEISGIVASGAVVGLCPTTEANLGDGVFPAAEFLAVGGRISIGSDSHVCVNPRSELRLLEYGQRLTTNKRAVLGTESKSVGRNLYESALEGGATALGVSAVLAEGSRADFSIINPAHPAIQLVAGDRILDRLVFCDAGNPIQGVFVGGVQRWPAE